MQRTDKRRRWTNDEIDFVTQASAEGKWPYEIAPLIGRSPGEVADLKRRYGIKREPGGKLNWSARENAPKLTLKRCAACGADTSTACPVPRCSRYTGEVIVDRTMFGVSSGW